MTKVTSKLLTFLLSFAMVFTSIGWFGVSEVNAAEGNTTLTVQVVDQGGAFVAGAELEFSDGANSYYFDPTGADGIASLTLDEQNDPDDGTFDILIDESSKLEVIEGVTVTVAHDESTYAPYFATVNGAAYNGETVTMKVKSSEPVAEAIDYVAVRANADEWKTWGVDFDAITADDFVLDVRPDSAWKAGHLPGATHVDVTAADSLTEDGKYIVADSDVAKALDKAFSDADGKRIVIVCVMGQTLAARTMQYFNETYFDGFGVDSSEVTYLIGGATNGIPEGTELVKAIDYVEVRGVADDWKTWGIDFDAITADDFVLDVRPDSAWKAGHLPGATHVDVTVADSLTEDGKYIVADSKVAKALDKACSDADGKRIVIVCVKGQTLAARTMQYFNETYFDGFGVDSSKVTYLIGGATDGIPEGTELVKAIDYVEVRADADEWKTWGIDFDAITADDFVLDVRPKAAFKAGHLPGSTHVDVTVADSLTEDGKYVADGSDVAKALNRAYSDADGKRIVIVCVKGQTLAARTMQYFNKTYFDGFGVDSNKVTYLIGGATDGIPEGTELEVGPEPAPDTTVPRTLGSERTKVMTVDIDMSKYDAGKVVKVWVPVPQTEDYQTISNVDFTADGAKAEITTDETYGNKMLYIEWDADTEPEARKATLSFEAARVEAGHPELIEYDESEFVYPADVAEYINKTSSMVQIDGIVKEYADMITEGRTGTLKKTRAIYEWIINNLERIDDGETLINSNGESKTFRVEGCGYGNTKAILTDYDTFGRAGGHCTDLNSTFVALCRASGIPAREMFGIRLGTNATDNASGFQHCWAEFYLPGTGWVFADPGDVLKAIKSGKGMSLDDMATARASATCKEKTAYFWGTVDNNRIVLSRGRDVTFNPPQAWGTCNTFGYPAAEVDGARTPLDFTVPGDFVYKITTWDTDFNEWTLKDFVIEGTTINGLTDSGKAKLKVRSELILPDKNAEGEDITAIGNGTNGMGTFGFTEDGKTYVPTSVVLPEKLESIGKFAFAAYLVRDEEGKNDQFGLTSVEFPETLKSIGDTAFQNAPLTEVIIPDSVTSIGTGAFTGLDANKVKISKVVLSKNLTVIPQSMFTSQSISEIELPEGITSIGRSSFQGNPIKEITIPDGVTEIGQQAFQSTDLAEIDIPASVTTIGNYAFRFSNVGGDRTSQLKKITLHEGRLTAIPNGAFANNVLLTEVILPSTVKTIHNNAFTGIDPKVKLLTDIEDQLNAAGEYTGITVNGSGHVVTSLSEYAPEALANLPSDITLEDKPTVEKARAVYDALSDEAREALPAGSVEKLEAAEAKIMALEAKEAQAAAEEAQRIAEEKQAEAEAAAAAAEEAQKQAEADKAAAEAAQKAAEEAAAEAEKAKQEAVEKQIAAEAAAAAAEAAQSGANDKAVAIVALASDLVDATKVKTADYKAGTVKKLQTAMEKAQAILKNTSASKADIEKADSDLKAAIKALVKKSANTLTVKAKKVTLKASKLKKKAQTVKVKKAFKVSKAKGKVTYKKVKGNKKISVSKTGKITVKKGLKKGKYPVKIKVSAAGDGNYKAGSKTVTVNITIK